MIYSKLEVPELSRTVTEKEANEMLTAISEMPGFKVVHMIIKSWVDDISETLKRDLQAMPAEDLKYKQAKYAALVQVLELLAPPEDNIPVYEFRDAE